MRNTNRVADAGLSPPAAHPALKALDNTNVN